MPTQQQPPPTAEWDVDVEEVAEPPVAVIAVKYYEDTEIREDRGTATPKCRDAPFAVLFWLQFLLVCLMAVTIGIPEYVVHLANRDKEEADAAPEDDDENDKEKPINPVIGWGLLFTFVVTAALISMGTLKYALRNPTGMIQFGLHGMVGLWAALALIFLTSGSLFGFLLCGLVTAIMVWWVRAVQDRIPFAAANLSCAVEAVKRYPQTVKVAGIFLALQVAWILVWLVAAVGYGARNVRVRQAGMPDAAPAYEAFATKAYASGLAPAVLQDPKDRRHNPVLRGDTEWGEYYGLFAGCRSIVFNENFPAPESRDSSDSGRDGFNGGAHNSNGAVHGGIYCACMQGLLVTAGECTVGNYAASEVGAHVGVYLALLLCLLWGGKVLSGVVHVTSSGVVAAWWFGAQGYARDESDTIAYAELDQTIPSSDGAAAAEGGLPVAQSLGADGAVGTGAVGTGAGTGTGAGAGQQQQQQQGQKKKGKGGKAFGKSQGSGKGVVKASLNRALGPSFGSICFGCLLVALLNIAEAIVKMLRDSCCSPEDGGGQGICYVCLCCVECALACLADLLEYFNRWAFTYVAVYGDAFIAAGRATNALFKRRGWSSIISDTLCSTALGFGSVVIALALGIAAALVAHFAFAAGTLTGPLALAALLSAYLMSSCLVAVLDAGVLTVIVCFAEDPRPCAEHHPEAFAELITAWRFFFGSELEAGGYDRLW